MEVKNPLFKEDFGFSTTSLQQNEKENQEAINLKTQSAGEKNVLEEK